MSTWFVVFNQPGPVRVIDENGTIWQAYRRAADIPNLNLGPHIATVRAREIEGGE
jgi:hypothetical protein